MSTVTVIQGTRRQSVTVIGVPGPQGPQGPAGSGGGDTSFVRTAAVDIAVASVVWEDATGAVTPLDSSDADHINLLCGLTTTPARSGEAVRVQHFGVVELATLSLTPGRVWLGAGGALTQTPPAAGFDVVVGSALAPTRLVLNIQDAIAL